MKRTKTWIPAALLMLSGMATLNACDDDDDIVKPAQEETVVIKCAKPDYLQKGDKVALISPSYFTPMENVEKTADVLRGWGLEPVIGPNVGKVVDGRYAGTVAEIMSVFAKVFVIIIAMHLLIIVFQYVVAGTVSKKNPFLMIKNMIPAYMTAIGTQSSAATIPVTLECTKKNGCDEKIADFVVPLCATIHLSGSTITLTSCAIAVMMLNGWNVSFAQMFPFILMLGVTMVAAPGVPGGAVMAALGILESMLGFNQNMLTLMIALYIAQDSFGTACNVTGDGAIAMLMDAITGKKASKA